MCCRRNKAFTLIEMIVVISIIVLAMTLAIPAIRSLTGSRSQEAAQNVLTTALGSARAHAIAMQKVTGILFVLDGGSDRINCVMVEQSDASLTDPGNVDITYLDAVSDVDPITLPAGLRLFTMKDTLTPQLNPNGYFQEYFTGRYMGYNSPGTKSPINPPDPAVINKPGGVILFDSAGRLCFRNWGLRLTIPLTPAAPAHPSLMSQLIYGPNTTLIPDWPAGNDSPYPWLNSSMGLVLVDRETFLNDTGQAGPYTDWNVQANQPDVDKYLDTNATPIFVNRYDATLISSQ